MKTEQHLKMQLGKEKNYKEKEKVDMTYVIQHLLKETFVVVINNKEYILDFGLGENGVIAYSWSGHPHLCSFEILEKAFKEGTWYKVVH
jgi:hypothetical protein